ncbi:hypothetical protein CBR_g16875 [Chara braunii]|uniref:Uncharacterized protein n=1 Tax=Chara braunii TaxID=69332 RepID=A0A388KU52_CHABU|nr:hypothetical protein CBR_g16875 [Chara braunii]|eukprot:GBG73532.1 hypothetical protein CBR_g16875 [Chara braunii]
MVQAGAEEGHGRGGWAGGERSRGQGGGRGRRGMREHDGEDSAKTGEEEKVAKERGGGGGAGVRCSHSCTHGELSRPWNSGTM